MPDLADMWLAAVQQNFPGLYSSLGRPIVVRRDAEISAAENLVVKFELALDFCHSFDRNQPIGPKNRGVGQVVSKVYTCSQ